MGWHLYLLTFRLKSPLHIGFHKIMHFYRTRAYVPARPFWGALTARLTRRLKRSDYEKIGEFLKRVMRFGYFYFSINEDENKNIIYIPRYTDEGLKFGNTTKEKQLSQVEFEKRFISSRASATIEKDSFTAEEGMLHEVEFISPYEIHKENEEPKPVLLKGLLWVREGSKEELQVQINEDNFLIIDGKNNMKFSDLADTLQIGGERKYGFGKLNLDKKNGIEKINAPDLGTIGFSGIWKDEKGEVLLDLKTNDFIWSHAIYNSNLKIKGNIEPIVGRDWSSKGSGRRLIPCGLCWAPGSKLIEAKTFKISEYGIWGVYP